MAGPYPEHTIRLPLGRMRWETVSFLHWAYDPAVVAPLVPSGLELDLWEGQAWVGIVSFAMVDVRPAVLPPVPAVSTFPEINVRTYVRAPDGLDGLLFLTLEASRAATLAARTSIGIGYAWGDMQMTRSPQRVEYRTRRRWPANPDAHSHHIVDIGEPLPVDQQTPFDHYLTGRWRAYSRRWGRLFRTPVEHEPWPLHGASSPLVEDRLVASCGLPPPEGEPLVHYAPGVDVRLGAPRLVG